MKRIVASVCPEKLGEVLESLYRTGVRGLTLFPAQGHDGETEPVEKVCRIRAGEQDEAAITPQLPYPPRAAGHSGG